MEVKFALLPRQPWIWGTYLIVRQRMLVCLRQGCDGAGVCAEVFPFFVPMKRIVVSGMWWRMSSVIHCLFTWCELGNAELN